MAINEWYKDRVDGIDTLDCDPDNAEWLAIALNGNFPSPASAIEVTASAVVEDAPGAAITGVAVDTDRIIFKRSGAGSLHTFRLSYGNAETRDFTVRLRAKQK